MSAQPDPARIVVESPKADDWCGPWHPSDLDSLMARTDLQVVPLHKNTPAVIDFLPAMGPLMSITSNPGATCTAWGPGCCVSRLGDATLVCEGTRSMRLLGQGWRHSAVALNRLDPGCPPSLLLFGEFGELAHQISLTGDSRVEGLQALVDAHQGCRNCLKHPQAPCLRARDFECPGSLLREAWCEASSPADLDARLSGLGLNRCLAARALEGLYSSPMTLPDFGDLIEELAFQAIPVHLELGNPYCLQILEGEIQGISRAASPWEIRMRDAFIRLDPDRIHSVWAVVQPLPGGERHRLECYGPEGELLLALGNPLQTGSGVARHWADRVSGWMPGRLRPLPSAL